MDIEVEDDSISARVRSRIERKKELKVGEGDITTRKRRSSRSRYRNSRSSVSTNSSSIIGDNSHQNSENTTENENLTPEEIIEFSKKMVNTQLEVKSKVEKRNSLIKKETEIMNLCIDQIQILNSLISKYTCI